MPSRARLIPGEALVPAPVLVLGRGGRLALKYPNESGRAFVACRVGEGSAVEGREVPGVDGAEESGIA